MTRSAMEFVSGARRGEPMDGALKPEYDSAIEDDVHHGNLRFGLLQWRAIADHYGAWRRQHERLRALCAAAVRVAA